MILKRSASSLGPRKRHPKYVYEPLQTARHIRLVRLLHFDPQRYRVYIDICQVDLGAAGKQFTALSYTWDSATEEFHRLRAALDRKSPHKAEIIVVPPEAFETFKRSDDNNLGDGKMVDLYTTNVTTLTVTANLSDWFITYLSDMSSEDTNLSLTRTFWIDALCIDQNNSAEKAVQIPLMGEIYSSAGRVLGWLGSDTTDLSTFRWFHHDVFQKLSEFLREDTDSRVQQLRSENCMEPGFWQNMLGLKPLLGTWLKSWESFWAFYQSRRWFLRAWIVQEVVLSGKLELQCSNVKLSWSTMVDFATLLTRLQWLEVIERVAIANLPAEFTDKIVRGYGITDVNYLHQHLSKGAAKKGWPYMWWAAIMAVRRRDCLHAEDKVWATFGILQNLLGPSADLPFAVDLAADPVAVYTLAAKALVQNRPGLDVLSFVEPSFRRKHQGLPSWVPDLSTAMFGVAMGTADTTFSAGMPLKTGAGAAHPPRDSCAKVTNSNELVIKGFKLGSIYKVYPYARPRTVGLCILALKVLADMPEKYPHELGGQDRVVALVHVLTCHELMNFSRGTGDETGRLMVDFKRWLLSGLGQIWINANDPEKPQSVQTRENAAELLRNIGVHPLLPTVEDLEMHVETVAAATRGERPFPEYMIPPHPFIEQATSVMLYRTIFSTQEGWIGVCWADTQPGDEVWILERGPVPYGLRPLGGRPGSFKYQGELYVHGAMYGMMTESRTREMETVALV